jgi:hypothetical protein
MRPKKSLTRSQVVLLFGYKMKRTDGLMLSGLHTPNSPQVRSESYYNLRALLALQAQRHLRRAVE